MSVRRTSANRSIDDVSIDHVAIDAGLLSHLREHVAAREIERGIACLRSHQDLIANLNPSQENAARLLAQVAIWTDIGFSGPRLQELLQRFEHLGAGSRSKLSIADYICLRMTEGMAAMAEEAMETAIAHFDFVLSLQEELDDRFLLAIAYFWKGRCLRRRGEYDEALIYTGKGKELALALDHPRMAAVMQVLESWLLFQQGKWKEAVRIAQAAEAVLGETDDYVTLGNLQSFYGRMARREGRFDKAITFFENAIRHYSQRDPRHLNLARSLANMALAKRGIALELQKRIDRDAQRRRKTPVSREVKASGSSHDYRSRLAQLRREALQHLEAARAIYQQRPEPSRSGHGLSECRLHPPRWRRFSARRGRSGFGVRSG